MVVWKNYQGVEGQAAIKTKKRQQLKSYFTRYLNPR